MDPLIIGINGFNAAVPVTSLGQIYNNTLAALTLLIAESNPKEKEIIIDLVMNFLKND